MKKKVEDLTLKEIRNICNNYPYSCDGCPLNQNCVCIVNIIQALDMLGVENFEKSLDQEIEVLE